MLRSANHPVRVDASRIDSAARRYWLEKSRKTLFSNKNPLRRRSGRVSKDIPISNFPNPMIEVESLTKQFGSKRAVNNLTFTVKKGEVLGFLGPNGAGKSTTMRMITGFIPPTAGDAKVCGISIVDRPAEAKTKIGYLPESAPLYNDMTVIGFLKFCAAIRGLKGAARNDAVERAIETCFLTTVAKQSIDTLSKGYRHRTCLAQALLHDPEVLILDEPTDGLDPNQKFEVRQLIKRLGQTKAILFSTHILEEVEASCSRAVIVDRGQIVADGTPAELVEQSGTGSLTDLFRKVTTRDTEAAA
jgi:ABC-2 type transport system ATP-binding protein